ncbi:hypothetical protein Clacol_000125 [Clathrus columnatus]|uniref:Uncharacterized protein n=1 Tax=Clathrus columnatus TaxID=1419009 RepID=A0AAV4ZZW8_9AGAM|nr:hypothetical protein Clacol_000125 [Clathrus columnatus]
MCFGDLTSLFPYLENLFYQPSTINLSFDTPHMQPHLKALGICIGRLDSFAMPGRFPGLRWLDLIYEPLIPWDLLLKALESLPNLQVLHLRPLNSCWSISEIRHPIITLLKRKVLIMYFNQISQLIHAPKLIHLHAENYPTKNDNGHFSGFDLSKITDIQLTIGKPSSFYIEGYDSGASCSFYHQKAGSIYDSSPILYGNKFKILLENLTPDGTIFPQLEKITYYTIEETLRDLSDIRPLQKLMQERFTKGREPLEIDLREFPPVHPKLLEEIGRLGIRLTQPKNLRSRKGSTLNTLRHDYLFLIEQAYLTTTKTTTNATRQRCQGANKPVGQDKKITWTWSLKKIQKLRYGSTLID